jgi:hypothetical protein
VIVEFVVAKGKKEAGRRHATLDGQRVLATENGPAPAPADVVFTLTPSDLDALQSGALDLSVGFMRGQIKMAGDFGTLLWLLPRTAGPRPAIPVASLLASS